MNWDAGVPTLIDEARINNGGVAVADGTSPSYPGGALAEANDLNIGFRDNTLSIPPFGTGSVQANDVGIHAHGVLRVGVVDAVGIGPFSNATGDLTTTGGGNNPGDVASDGEALFGVYLIGVGAGQATGAGTISGNLTGMTGDLLIGETRGFGKADGMVDVSGDVSGYTNVVVGRTRLDSTGNANGVLAVGGSLSGVSAVGSLSVGTDGEAGNVTGTATVGTGISDFRTVSVGSAGTDATGTVLGTLDVLSGGVHSGVAPAVFSSFNVGTTNGDSDATGQANVVGGITNFRSLEIGVARLATSTGNAGGLLQVSGGPVTGSTMRVGVSEGVGTAAGIVSLDTTLVELDDSLTLGAGSGMIFRLDGFMRGTEYAAINVGEALLDGVAAVLFDFAPAVGSHIFDLIVTDSLNGITGDFDSFSIFNLDPMFTTTYGIEVVGGAEVFRLRIEGGEQVPEPGLLILFSVGLAGLGVARNRRPGALLTTTKS